MVPEKTTPPEITLRRMELSDVDHLLMWIADDQVSYFTHWETRRTREEAMEYLKSTVLPHPWFRAICVGGTPVGFVSARPKSGRNSCRATFSGCVVRKNWNRGIATAALRLAVATVFEVFTTVQRVEALVAVENASMQKALEKAGFTREGEHRKFYATKGKVWDVARYSIIRVDPKL
ncbi:unnamed protein product [Spirodela intermedia]|uniref:N-acetyltransferase domain-containing protein n=1 Tax=Spirodela intermedia TaxID=51605 RepID=A0A7I8KAX9_SPIIN|nr:unnamed protein product [Spirodela intermedia]